MCSVLRFNGTGWNLLGNTHLGSREEGKEHGLTVSMSADGSIVACGTRYFASGVVRVYRLTENTWTQLGQKLTGTGWLDQFGHATAWSSYGNTLVVGALQQFAPDSPEGYVVAFRQYLAAAWRHPNWL